MPYRFVTCKQIRESAALRESFFSLARSTFDIDFSPWHAGGFWGERYIPYALAEGDRVVSNVSVNVLDVLYDGAPRRYVQLGTVMSDPAFRGSGLARRLMEAVLADWREKCDMLYLYANDTALDFYPKFGFERAVEHAQTLRLRPATGVFLPPRRSKEKSLPGSAPCTHFPSRGSCEQQALPHAADSGVCAPDGRRNQKGSPHAADLGDFAPLDLSRKENLALFSRLYAQNNPFSRITMRDNFGLVMFYCGSIFADNVLYSKKRDAICIAVQEGKALQCLDIFCAPDQELDEILSEVAAPGTETVLLGFSAKAGAGCAAFPIIDDALFVLPGKDNPFAKDQIRMPLLSHA